MLQSRTMLFHITNATALIECVALAVLLILWADKVVGAWLLILFLAGVSLWILGNELPTWFGPGASRAGLTLLCTAPLASALFLWFAASFSRFRPPAWIMWGICALAALVGLVAAFLGPGQFRPVQGLGLLAFPNKIGWTASLCWAGLAAAGHAVLVRAWWVQGERQRTQIMAIGVSSLLGALCMSGYGITVLHLPISPWPLALLPAYPLALVYAILRYRVFIANDWAQRALAWGLLTVLAAAIIALVAALPLGQSGPARLVSGGFIAVLCLWLAGPMRLLAQRLVYPGGVAGADDLRHWRASLRGAETEAQLASKAEALLSRRLGMGVQILLRATVAGNAPALLCAETPDGFHTSLAGWDAAPPGPRRLAELFGTVLAEEADRLARAETLAARERERQTEARLAELGALAATIAHDVRNPLNIIRMAAAGTAPELRGEIDGQVARISRLTSDLLDYAKPWKVTVQEIDAATLLRRVTKRYSNIEHGTGLHDGAGLRADPQRLEQALVNLLDNAALVSHRILVDFEQKEGTASIAVCDDGPGIPEDIRDRLFTPFVSRNPGGTGLGLAIVARVMAAHGGSVRLVPRSGWTTCFVLEFPA